jgi:ATP-dependent DNA helicase RecQ
MSSPHEILKKYWNFDQFRPLQEDIVNSVIAGKDTLALLPTGGGKSICFQVPALCMDGVCLVVSPLIALMKDQVYNLKKRGIAAEAIFSGMPNRDIDRILDNAVYGGLKFLYLSPERLKTELAIARIRQMKVNILAIDEAHCVSQWGYDFRPPYLMIAEIREFLPKTPILALTATATPEVVVDIQEKLLFREKNVFQKSFARPNIAYVVLDVEDKIIKTIEIFKKMPGSGVVYARNRKKTKEIAFLLQKNGVVADFYHAGLSAEERSEKQDAWIKNQTRVMVSTNAFGMGIDKPDVRTVVHVDVPDNLEAYFQEAGRGGRDEKNAYAVLLTDDKDAYFLKKNYENAFPEMKTIRQVYRALGSYFQVGIGGGAGESYDFDILEFCNNFRFENQLEVLSAIKVLEQAEWLMMSESVFIPSSVQIIVNNQEMYAYQLKNKKADLLLKTISRAYTGIFDHYTFINEYAISNAIKMDKPELIKLLQHIDNEGIIKYQQQKDKPQMVFLKERLNADDIIIDSKLYNFRKERYLERVEKTIEYFKSKRCRSRLLLEYFGEKEVKDCGVCDYCLHRAKEAVSQEEFERYSEKILFLLKKEKLSVTQVIESFHLRKNEQILKVLEYMSDNHIILRENDILSLPKE